MSASLVGSEMCIRDSSGSGGSGKRREWRQRYAPVGRSRSCGPGRPPGSVSYTHLTLPTICSV
eukprot:2367898-Alexandrium_andersonii.AAC.1